MNNNLPTGPIAAAIEVLNQEKVIAYPTEAVFGVGCDPDSETAVSRLLELKQRPVEKGLILIAANFEQLKPYIDDSGLPPCRTVEEVRAQFGTDFPVVEGETGGRLNPSEIRDALTGEQFRQG